MRTIISQTFISFRFIGCISIIIIFCFRQNLLIKNVMYEEKDDEFEQKEEVEDPEGGVVKHHH